MSCERMVGRSCFLFAFDLLLTVGVIVYLVFINFLNCLDLPSVPSKRIPAVSRDEHEDLSSCQPGSYRTICLYAPS